jgi:hypothetical protein
MVPVADGGVFRSRLQDPADCHRLHAIDPKREKAGRSFVLLPTGMQARPRRGVMIICLYLYCETRCKAESVRFGGRACEKAPSTWAVSCTLHSTRLSSWCGVCRERPSRRFSQNTLTTPRRKLASYM